MKNMCLQTLRVLALSIASLPQRRSLVLVMLLATTLVVLVLVAFPMMTHGFALTLKGANAADVALIFRGGTKIEGNSTIPGDTVEKVASLSGVASSHGVALVSPELYVVVSGYQKTDGLRSNIAFRGVEEPAIVLRPGFEIVRGRMFKGGEAEIVVGEALTRHFSGFELGKVVRYGASKWRVVGIFKSDGNVFESEIWGEARMLQAAFNRGNTYQVIRVKLENAAAFPVFSKALADARLDLEAQTERGYYGEQAQAANALALRLGVQLSFVMVIGAVIAALNTMFGSIATRTRDLAILRALGFRRLAVFFAEVIESLIIAVGGSILALLILYAAFDGYIGSTFGNNLTQIVFVFSLSGALVLRALICGVVVGAIGGIPPALHAVRAPIAPAMRVSG